MLGGGVADAGPRYDATWERRAGWRQWPGEVGRRGQKGPLDGFQSLLVMRCELDMDLQRVLFECLIVGCSPEDGGDAGWWLGRVRGLACA